MRSSFRNASPELYLVVAIAISLALAAVLSRVPALVFGGFLAMAAVLIAADLVLYLLMKLGVFKAPRDRAT